MKVWFTPAQTNSFRSEYGSRMEQDSRYRNNDPNYKKAAVYEANEAKRAAILAKLLARKTEAEAARTASEQLILLSEQIEQIKRELVEMDMAEAAEPQRKKRRTEK
jgi:hypothetical protein